MLNDMNDRSPPNFLTTSEVATLLRVSRMTVHRLITGGELAAVRVGRQYRIYEVSFNEYLAREEGTP